MAAHGCLAMAAQGCLSAISSIVSDGAKTLFELIIREISYVPEYKSNIDGLKEQVEQLKQERQRVKEAVDRATRQGDKIFDDVEIWLKKVDGFIAKPIIDTEDGLGPNLISRYRVSKQAATDKEAAPSLIKEGDFREVSYRPAPESTEYAQVKDYEAFDSRMKVFQDVVEALKDDKLNIIGVYGMGGVGKTTLVKQIAKQVMEDKVFDKVVMAEVTQNPDAQKIQEKLASDLGMNFDSNQSIFHRANQLRRGLKNEKRVLVILDNIWKKLEFEEVGIPSGGVAEKDRKDDQRRCTIILTSREQDLLRIDMNSQKNFPIDALPRKEALQLFEKIVGDSNKIEKIVGDSSKISDFRSTANEIVEKCGGLPVALSTVANALKTKGFHFWKDALTQLRSDAREIHGMQANVYTSIKLSYDFLESEEAKSLFRLCALYSEGHAIRVSDLLRYGVGWGLFENVYTLEEARSRVHRLIDNLKSSCLLLDGDAEDEVKMHDVVHVVAVSIAAEKRMFNIPNVADVEKKMEETIRKDPIAISLPQRDIKVLPERLQCPHLQLFLLFGKGDGSMQVSDHFFEGTEVLKVLNFTGIHFSSLPSSLGRLINLQTLCLDYCRLKDIAIVGQLKNLEIFSLVRSDIEQLPLEIGQLTRLQLLDLSDCDELKMIIGPDAEKPTTTQRFTEIIAEDDPVYMVTFPRLEELKLYSLRNIEKLWPDQSQGMHCCQNLTKVTVERCDSLKYLFSYSMVNSLGQLQHLEINACKSMEGVVNNTARGLGGRDELKVFPKLHSLRLHGLPKLSSFASPEDVIHTEMQPQPQPLFDEKVTFPRLEGLKLKNLGNIEKLWPDQSRGMHCCQKLTKVIVKRCNRLKYLFSYSMVNSLGQLQHLEISLCESMEGVVNNTTGGLGGRDELKVFPKLHSLKLEWLPKLRGFVSTEDVIHTEMQPQPLFDEKVIFPRLEELELDGLINIEKLWPDQFQGMYCCQNLTKVTVEWCWSLKYLFSYSMVNSLGQLQHLQIGGCKSMEGVVNNTTGGLGGRDELKVFPKLHYLRLGGLRELRSFASPEDVIHTEMQPQTLFDEKVRLPSLEVLRISGTDKLRKIWHHQLASESFGKLKELEIRQCRNLMNIFPPLVGIPRSLVNLNVSGCKKLEEIIGHAGEEVKENRIAFSELKLLKLDGLPRLTSFCSENYTLEFPSLERVSMTRCEGMKTFSQGIILSTPKLYEVEVITKKEDESRHWEGNLNSTIQKCYKEMVGFRGLQNLKLSDFPHLRELWHGPALPVGFFNDLEHLVVDDCKNMSSAIPANLLRYLNNLHHLEVRNCDSLEEVFHLEELNSEEAHFGPLFPKLSNLSLIDLPKLKRFCNFTENIIELPELRYLTIENCPNMDTFVSNSASVLHVTTDNKEPQKLTSEENFLLADQMKPLFDEKVAFPQLIWLKMSGLHKVQHLWKENAESNKVFVNLGSLKVSECSELQNLVPSSWHLENLWELEVSKCHGLINALTLLTSKSLVNLESMKIADCKMIKEIIQSQVGEEAKDCIVFGKLKYLGLDCLPSLTSFCLGNYALEFPSLEQVVVRQCPTMKIFSQGVVDTPKLKKVKLTEEYDDDDEGCWEGNLNDTVQKLFNEMNSKDKIEPTLQVQ